MTEILGLRTDSVDRFKTSMQFILLPYGAFYDILDALKVADYSLLLLSSRVEVSGWGDTLLRTMQAQGFPTTVAAISPSSSIEEPHSSKDKAAILKSLLSFVRYFIPSHGRVFDLEATASSTDALNVARALCEGKPTDIRWREERPYMMIEESEYIANDMDNKGTLLVTGILRGAPFSANRLVHLPNLGDFKVKRVCIQFQNHHIMRLSQPFRFHPRHPLKAGNVKQMT